MIEIGISDLKSVWWNGDGLTDTSPSKSPRIHIYEGLYRGNEQDLSTLESI